LIELRGREQPEHPPIETRVGMTSANSEKHAMIHDIARRWSIGFDLREPLPLLEPMEHGVRGAIRAGGSR
jgi:hypothetical protein